MSDYLDLLIDRTTSETALIRPRLPALFEPQADPTSQELLSGEPGPGDATREEVVSQADDASSPGKRGSSGRERGRVERADVPIIRHARLIVEGHLPAKQGKPAGETHPQLLRADPSGGKPDEEQNRRFSGANVDREHDQPEVHVIHELIREPVSPVDGARIVESGIRHDEEPSTPLPVPVVPLIPLAALPTPQRLEQAPGAANAPASQPPAAQVTVRIGRIEIRVARPPGSASTRRPAPAQRKPVMSLDSYLTQRSKEKS